MSLGLIADIVIIGIVAFIVLVCTKRGFLRSALGYVSTLLALFGAMFGASPVAAFFDRKFGWLAVVEGWQVPLVPAGALYKILVGVALFIAIRLVLIILDKVLHILKEKLTIVNIVDRILGTVFGLVIAVVVLAVVFKVVNDLNLADFLQLTPAGGSYVAQYVYVFFLENIVPTVNAVFAAIPDVVAIDLTRIA